MGAGGGVTAHSYENARDLIIKNDVEVAARRVVGVVIEVAVLAGGDGR